MINPTISECCHEIVGMKRIYEAILAQHLEKYDLMAFISGLRQVGKTTLAQSFKYLTDSYLYISWDNLDSREKILSGPGKLLADLNLNQPLNKKAILVLDEIHKYDEWSTFVKGIYDEYKDKIRIIVTGSARLNVYRRGGDSLMGRYFLYRMHPISVGELVNIEEHKDILSKPKEISRKELDQLLQFGGFPAPFLSNDEEFSKRWHGLRHLQLMTQDLRDMSDIHSMARIEVLVQVLRRQVGQLLNYSTLSNHLRVDDKTVRNWIEVLEGLFYCYKISPWSKNIARSLLKNPKLYLWDWSIVEGEGHRLENFVASHLLKAVQFWTDMGKGDYELYFIRDKDKHEVDFVVVENEEPLMLIEVKKSMKEPLSESLRRFSKEIKPKYTFQLAYDMPYMDFDIRDLKEPMIVPMSSFLSQLP